MNFSTGRRIVIGLTLVSCMCAGSFSLKAYAKKEGGGGGGHPNHQAREAQHEQNRQRREERREQVRQRMGANHPGHMGGDSRAEHMGGGEWGHGNGGWAGAQNHLGQNENHWGASNGTQNFNWNRPQQGSNAGNHFGNNFAENHPRRAEVLGRDNNINNRINGDRGELGGHYGQLEREDNGIRRQERADARLNGGHITQGEQSQLNREENHLNNQIKNDYRGNNGSAPVAGSFAQNHPRRAETLGRDNNLNNEINADKGNLGGHYNQLEREDSAIRAQEQADAKLNGGYITRGEQHQLNREENHLQHQINRDDPSGAHGGTTLPSASGSAASSGSTPGSAYGGAAANGSTAGAYGAGNGSFAQNHPRRAEVLGRDNNLNNELNADKGNLGGHYNQLEREDSAIRAQEQADARYNGGYITRGEQHQLNREENHLQSQINRDDPAGAAGGAGAGSTGGGTFSSGTGSGSFAQNHPRRAEVLGRDNNLNNEINADRGNLGGHYNQLEREDGAIRAQEQADARYNGGHITSGEQRQLNREENHLQQQINRDDRVNPAYNSGSPASYSGNGTSLPTGTGGGGYNNLSGNGNHPRETEVLNRDNNLNKQINADKGNLGGHYNQLERQAQGIQAQEQADALYNGGHITRGEQHELNREENRLKKEIKHDDRPAPSSTGSNTGSTGNVGGAAPNGAAASGSASNNGNSGAGTYNP